MGQAKKRGTFEQRRTEAFIREAARQEQERIELAARKEQQRLDTVVHPKPTPARRRHGMRSTMLAAAMTAMAIGLSQSAPTIDEKGSA